MINVVERALDKGVPSGSIPTETEAEMHDLVQIKSMDNIIGQIVLSDTYFVV